MLKIGIVGYGGMGRFHAENILPKEKSIEIAGIYDILQRQMDLGERDGWKTYHSYEEMLSDPKVDIVLIATENDIHKELAIQAFKKGKHVICEKPVTLSAVDFDIMIANAYECGCYLFVHQNRRWDKDFIILQELLEENEIGTVLKIESRAQGDHGIPSGWREYKRHGGGMLLDWGVHLIDQVVTMCKAPVESVYGTLSYVLGSEADDGFTTFLKYNSGLEVEINVDTTNYIKQPRWYIKGTKGTILLNDWDMQGEIVKVTKEVDKNKIKAIQAGAGLTHTLAPLPEDVLVKEDFPQTPQKMPPSFYENVCDVILNHAEPLIKHSEIREVLVLMEAIFKSSEKNKIIEIS